MACLGRLTESASFFVMGGVVCLLKECTGEACLADALISLMGILPNAQWLLTTLGKRGSVLLQRPSQTNDSIKVHISSKTAA